MKKLFTFCILFLTVSVFAQTNFYWTAYHFEVKPGQEDDVINAFDRFFESETGKAMPYASLNGAMFTNSGDKHSHALIFSSADKEDFNKMYSGMLQQSVDFALLGLTMEQSIKGVASYLGKSLIAEPVPGNNYSTIYELAVSDPAAYAKAFTTFRNAIRAKTNGKLGLDLHQFVSGNEKGATHVVVANAASFGELLDFTDMIFSSTEYATFAAAVKDIRTILRVFTEFRAKEYNLPD